MRHYTKIERKRKMRWHKGYNQEHNYGVKGIRGTKYSWSEKYLIMMKRLRGGRILTDIEIAKLLKRSLQAIQLKRMKIKRG